MVKAGLIPKLVELLKRPPYRARGLRLLYHMSIDDRCKAMFAYTDVSTELAVAASGTTLRVVYVAARNVRDEYETQHAPFLQQTK